MRSSDAALHRAFMDIVKKSAKNNTYKFALALFLIEHAGSSKTLEAGYEDVARCFFKYYWSHACKSKLRQGPVNQVPVVIDIIKKEFSDDAYPQSFARLQQEFGADVGRCVSEIAKECLHDVVPRFQWVNGSRKELFFEYESIQYFDSARNERLRSGAKILIKPDAAAFLKKYGAHLRNSVILEWVKFLEALNFGTPNLAQKVEAKHAGKRNQRKFIKLLEPITKQCFYCDENLAFDAGTHVDHVLPFSYVGDTEMWNLVLACRRCNCDKMDFLPPRRYVRDLCERNLACACEIKDMRDSLARLYYEGFVGRAGRFPRREAGIMRERIAWHYKNAASCGYKQLRKFP